MQGFEMVATLDELVPGQGLSTPVAGRPVALFLVPGPGGAVIHAIEDRCLHRNAPLVGGQVDGGVVTCPWHAWRWELATGACLFNPAVRVSVFEVRVAGEQVWVSTTPRAEPGRPAAP